MKLYRFITIVLAGASIAASCSKMDEIKPQGGTLLADQVKETTVAVPSRVGASFNSMFTSAGSPCTVYISMGSYRPDDFGYISMAFSTDIEAADVIVPDSGYNWFSVCGTLSSRTANYANPYMRYALPYNQISAANDVITSFPADTEDKEILATIAQAKAMRAFAYLNLVPYFQFNYATAKDKPSVPLVTEETVDFTNNPRATVAEAYAQIIADLDYAVENLEGYTRTDKSKIDANVAHGLRARAYLNMGEWQKAYDDAVAAAEGYTPATIEELSNTDNAARLSFKDISEHNWIWGYDMTPANAETYKFATSSSWIRSFSAWGYAPQSQCYAMINSMLWNKISATDVRKGWWVDDNLESPLLAGQAWPGCKDVANAEVANVKEVFLPYTNVKFGCYSIGTITNDEDWPYMRVEEMILIQAECLAKLSKEGEARKVLDDFIGTYRDPEYKSTASHCKNLLDEIWFQRRVELWGEGFSNNDTRRLGKPLVRIHSGEANNQPDAFAFNMTADDGWWLMRFPQSEMNTNFGIEDNKEGSAPKMGQNGDLRDGVTD